MKNQKGFIPIIIILVVLFGFVGIYYLGTLKPKSVSESPNTTIVVSTLSSSVPSAKPVVATDQTADWKTYINSKHKFSFSYPGTWNIDENLKDYGELRLVFFPSGSVLNEMPDGNIIVSIQWGAGDTRTLDYLKSEYFPKSIRLFIGNKEMLKDGLFAIVKVDHENSIEIRGGEYNINQKAEASVYFDQILSTFKFIN